jgi:hypothetical protein
MVIAGALVVLAFIALLIALWAGTVAPNPFTTCSQQSRPPPTPRNR